MAPALVGLGLLSGPARRTVLVLDGSDVSAAGVPSAEAPGLEGLVDEESGSLLNAHAAGTDAALKYFGLLQAFDTSQQAVILVAGKEGTSLQLCSWSPEAQGPTRLADAFSEVQAQEAAPCATPHLDWKEALPEALDCLMDGGDAKDRDSAEPGSGAAAPAGQAGRGRIILLRYEGDGTPAGPTVEMVLDKLTGMLDVADNSPTAWPLARCDVVLLQVDVTGASEPLSPQREAFHPSDIQLGETASCIHKTRFCSVTAIRTKAHQLPAVAVALADTHLGLDTAMLDGIPMNVKRTPHGQPKKGHPDDGRKHMYTMALKCKPCDQQEARLPEGFAWLPVPNAEAPGMRTVRHIWQVCLVGSNAHSVDSLTSYLRHAGQQGLLAAAGSPAAAAGKATHILSAWGSSDGIFLLELCPTVASGDVQSEATQLMPTADKLAAFREKPFQELALGSGMAALPAPLPLLPCAEPALNESDYVSLSTSRKRILTTRRLERLTRCFPLMVKESVIDAKPALGALLGPIHAAFQGADIPEAAISLMVPLLLALQTHTRSNAGVLLHNGVASPEQRRQLYAQAWAELGTAAEAYSDVSPGHEKLAEAVKASIADLKTNPTQEGTKKPKLEAQASTGTPGQSQLPIQLGPSASVLRLGKLVVDRPGFHSKNYMLPVGFRSQRMYASYTVPHRRVPYTCEILDGGDAPLFKLTAEDSPSTPVTGNSATSVWAQIVQRVAILKAASDPSHKGKQLPNVSGPEYFGFANPQVAQMIQELPGADKLRARMQQAYAPGGAGKSAPGSAAAPGGGQAPPAHEGGAKGGAAGEGGTAPRGEKAEPSAAVPSRPVVPYPPKERLRDACTMISTHFGDKMENGGAGNKLLARFLSARLAPRAAWETAANASEQVDDHPLCMETEN
eukprot:jgi/Tetstr1/428838/TSEL_018825.t1